MGAGHLIYFGLGMLLIVPVFMGSIGAIFGETITRETQQIDSDIYADIYAIEQQQSGFWGWLSGIFTPSPGSIISNVLTGYSIFPWWVNVFLTVIPVVLLIRGIISTSA